MTPIKSSNRRDFLLASAGLGLGAMAHAASRSPAAEPARAARAAFPRGEGKRLLMLGGTSFLGPHIVRNALDAGWQVTLFNRGRTNPKLFPDLETLIGDRNEGHEALQGGGEWDAAVDTSGYIPHHVLEACETLKDRVGHYVFVSTISVYADGPGEVDEDHPVGQVEPERMNDFQTTADIGKHGFRYYGPLKALCEQAAESVMPGRVANVRPGLIVGPEDDTDRFTYWPVRVHEGGEVLAPGDPEAPVQVIDVRDLGAFCFRLAADKTPGVMNAIGFRGKVTMRDLVHGAKLATGADCSFTWVPDDFLLAQSVGPWMELPLWIPGAPNTYTNARAYAAGMQTRPLAETLRATLDWHLAERGEGYQWRGAGLAREKEKAVLAAWHAR
jgi:2'-hydroxyisoflavone reductase